MTSYKVEMPSNYQELHDLGHIVSSTILSRKVPQPAHIAKILGQGNVSAYYLMHALMHSKEYGQGRDVLVYARRDKKAPAIHPFDSAVKPYFRVNDRDLPSRYILTPREQRGILIHDLNEDYGESLLGVFVVNDIISYLLGEETGKDAILDTNKNGLLLKSLENEIIKLPIKNHNGVYRLLEEKLTQLSIKPLSIPREYRRVLSSLYDFEKYIDKEVDYMPEQKDDLLMIINEMSTALTKKIKNKELLGPSEVEEQVKWQYMHVMEIMKHGNYIDVDRNLVLPGDQEFLLTLNKTLYWDFISNIAENVQRNSNSVLQNEHAKNDSYLSPIMVKLADSTNTVANMDQSPLTNATSIFRKARISIAAGIILGGYLKNQQNDYQRLHSGVDYLFRNLEHSVDRHLEYLSKSAMGETNYELDLKIFEVMKGKMKDLEILIAEMQEPSLVENVFKRIGNIFRPRKYELEFGGRQFTR